MAAAPTDRGGLRALVCMGREVAPETDLAAVADCGRSPQPECPTEVRKGGAARSAALC